MLADILFYRVTEDFKAELSEIRKNCKNHNGTTTTTNGESGEGGEGLDQKGEKADLEGRLEALTAAYNDIQVYQLLLI